DAVMLRVFPITLTGAAKRWVDRLPPGTEGDETLYQAWERYNDLLYKFPTHDINNHQKVNIFYNGLGAMNRQLLDSQGPIPGMTPVQALTTIQTMVDHSQKWHDGSSSRNIESSSNSERIAAIVNKLETLGRDMKKLKENIHAIQVGCQTCEGAHLDKDCPLNEEVKTLANEVKGRANNKQFDECKTIYSKNGLPLYTPFYYSPEEIEYFSANSGFSDNEEQETDDSGMAEAVAALEGILKKKREEPKKVKQNVNYYVDPYEPPIPFPKRLEHHAEEALVHQTMESLKKIKINRPLLKEIRQPVNYANQMKYLDPVNTSLHTIDHEIGTRNEKERVVLERETRERLERKREKIFLDILNNLLFLKKKKLIYPVTLKACSFMLCDLDFEPLSLSLSSLPSCDLVSLTNMLILLHYLESFKSELAEVFVFKS
ncbi:hypothetical protein Tco_1208340, partial [Tanacetum coccineum]